MSVMRSAAVIAAVTAAAFCGAGLAAPVAGATRVDRLVLRPGIGIGPVRIGEKLNALGGQFPKIAVHHGIFVLRVDNATLIGTISANRIRGVHSTASDLVLGSTRLQDHPARESQKLINAGWKRSTCIARHTLVYRRDRATGRITAVAWAPGAPPLALVQPRIPSAWTDCSAAEPGAS